MSSAFDGIIYNDEVTSPAGSRVSVTNDEEKQQFQMEERRKKMNSSILTIPRTHTLEMDFQPNHCDFNAFLLIFFLFGCCLANSGLSPIGNDVSYSLLLATIFATLRNGLFFLCHK